MESGNAEMKIPKFQSADDAVTMMCVMFMHHKHKEYLRTIGVRSCSYLVL